MPNRSKQKGDRAERQIVELLRSYGLDAYRVPLSGAVNGFKDDIEIRLGNETLRLESKVRAGGFARIYKWLAAADCLVIKADREQPLAIISLDRLAKLISASNAQEQAKPQTSAIETLAQTPLIENETSPTKIPLNVGPRSIGFPSQD